MNNNIKGIDTNVGSIEEDKKRLMKSLNYELDKLITSKAETATAVVNLKQPIILMFLSLLSKLEQDEKRIKELEVANKMQEYRINEMDIPKQKVKDIIEKRKNNCTVINSFIIEVLEELLEDK